MNDEFVMKNTHSPVLYQANQLTWVCYNLTSPYCSFILPSSLCTVSMTWVRIRGIRSFTVTYAKVLYKLYTRDCVHDRYFYKCTRRHWIVYNLILLTPRIWPTSAWRLDSQLCCSGFRRPSQRSKKGGEQTDSRNIVRSGAGIGSMIGSMTFGAHYVG